MKSNIIGLVILLIALTGVSGATTVFSQSTLEQSLSESEDSSISIISSLLEQSQNQLEAKMLFLEENDIEIPASAKTSYEEGKLRALGSHAAISSSNLEVAEVLSLEAMSLFEKATQELLFIQNLQPKTSTENVFTISKTISTLEKKSIEIKSFDDDSVLEINEYDDLIDEAKNSITSGDIDVAQEKLRVAENLLDDAFEKIQQKADDNEERVKQFVSNTLEHIDSIILDAEKLDISQPTLDDFKNIRETLKNSEDVSLIIETSDDDSELNLLIEEVTETEQEKIAKEFVEEIAETESKMSVLDAELQEKLAQEEDPEKRAELEAEYAEKQQDLQDKIQEEKEILEDELSTIKQKRAELEAEYAEKQQDLQGLLSEKTAEFESQTAALELPYLEEKEKLAQEFEILKSDIQTQISELEAELQEKLDGL